MAQYSTPVHVVLFRQICQSGLIRKFSQLQMKITIFSCFMLCALSRTVRIFCSRCDASLVYQCPFSNLLLKTFYSLCTINVIFQQEKDAQWCDLILRPLNAQLRSIASRTPSRIKKIMVKKSRWKTDTIADLMFKDFKQILRMFLRNKILSRTLLCQTLF